MKKMKLAEVQFAECYICDGAGEVGELGQLVPCDVCKGSGRISRSVEGMAEELLRLRARVAQLEAVAEAAAVISDIIALDDLIPPSVSYLKTFNDALDAAGYGGE